MVHLNVQLHILKVAYRRYLYLHVTLGKTTKVQPMRMCSPTRLSTLTLSIATRASKGNCSDFYQLVIGSYTEKSGLFHHIACCTFSHS